MRTRMQYAHSRTANHHLSATKPPTDADMDTARTLLSDLHDEPDCTPHVSQNTPPVLQDAHAVHEDSLKLAREAPLSKSTDTHTTKSATGVRYADSTQLTAHLFMHALRSSLLPRRLTLLLPRGGDDVGEARCARAQPLR
jgi:hypothetical protein